MRNAWHSSIPLDLSGQRNRARTHARRSACGSNPHQGLQYAALIKLPVIAWRDLKTARMRHLSNAVRCADMRMEKHVPGQAEISIASPLDPGFSGHFFASVRISIAASLTPRLASGMDRLPSSTRREPAMRGDNREPGPPPEAGGFRSSGEDDGLAFEVPVFEAHPTIADRVAASRPREHEIAWVIFNLNLPYVRQTMLPESAAARSLRAVATRIIRLSELSAHDNPDSVIFQSDPHTASGLGDSSDASVSLFEPQISFAGRRSGPGGPGGGGGPWASAGRGLARSGPRSVTRHRTLEIYARHRAGSLDCVIGTVAPPQSERHGRRSAADAVTATCPDSVTPSARNRWLTRRWISSPDLRIELRTAAYVIHTASL